ncbi:membrane hypothetical protein [Mesorhizobium prunaredense]|uniref:Transmembrane protein n=1 Tax=Mesorhizobium prunaredense TaxID=1631249 RepID=A0A1R3VH96_9HYPH|nr:hypothetical protein [Mesorhizobium prunaredense]SIT59297.1 membrane hypothetical protein [Mesorhizobium prunaredense]
MANLPDWKNASHEVTRFVFDQADKYLSTQITAGIAADQRATSAAATFSGFSGAILAASVGYYAAKPDLPMLSAGIATGIAFGIAAGCSFYSARPVDFNYPGNEPEKWYGSLSQPLDESIGIEAENYSAGIAENAEILAGNAMWLTVAFWAAAIAPLAGLALYGIASLFSHG